jgi:hypothetical protein
VEEMNELTQGFIGFCQDLMASRAGFKKFARHFKQPQKTEPEMHTLLDTEFS